jgi:alpha/beta superfamily hydrolase
MLRGARHFFDGRREELTARIVHFLDRVFEAR